MRVVRRGYKLPLHARSFRTCHNRSVYAAKYVRRQVCQADTYVDLARARQRIQSGHQIAKPVVGQQGTTLQHDKNVVFVARCGCTRPIATRGVPRNLRHVPRP